MAKPKYEIVVNVPDKEKSDKLLAKVYANIISSKIETLPYEQQIAAYDEIEKLYKKGGIEHASTIC